MGAVARFIFFLALLFLCFFFLQQDEGQVADDVIYLFQRPDFGNLSHFLTFGQMVH